MEAREIKELFVKFGADIDKGDVWQVQSATVIKHKALERLAAAAKIEFSPPQVLRAERDEAVILVSGKLGERSEWSVGEALVNVNYRVTGKMAAYVYAMAEKRAKDRVILKLAGLHGLYSEDEADEFKESSFAPQQGRNVAPASSPSASSRPAGAATLSVTERMIAAVNMLTTAKDIFDWWNLPKVQEAFNALSPANQEAVDAAKRRKLAEIEGPFQEAAE